MYKGVYVLLIYTEAGSIKAGTLGNISVRKGYYAYVGSALGCGGFARVKRHIRLSREKRGKNHWHIDNLLMHPESRLTRVYCLRTGKQVECFTASCMSGEVVLRFGSSDCSCPGHLFFFPSDPHEEIFQILSSQDTGEVSVLDVR